MKKVTVVLAALFLGTFLVAGSAMAFTFYDGGIMNVTPSGPTYYTWLGDYDGTKVDSDLTPMWTFADEEIFCASKEYLESPQLYDFFKFDGLDAEEDTAVPKETLAFQQAAWIADQWLISGDTTDAFKAEAQGAIWKILGVYTGNLNTEAQDLYNAALGIDGWITENWLLAYTPIQYTETYIEGRRRFEIIVNDSQDFLVPAPKSVPEPASMLLLGSGLLGLALVGRKRFTK